MRLANYWEHHCFQIWPILNEVCTVYSLFYSKYGGTVTALDDGPVSRYMKTHFEDMRNIEIPQNLTLVPTRLVEEFERGFALLKTPKHVRFTEEQEAFIKEMFERGIKDKALKVTPSEAVYIMRRKINDNGQRQFQRDLWLTEEQFVTAFGRISAQKRMKEEKAPKVTMDKVPADLLEAMENVSDDLIEEAIQDNEQENELVDLANVASILQDGDDPVDRSHPITVSN